MCSLKQIQANRRNALLSTGPVTVEGKRRSRCNAVRHGLTAVTVIGELEDTEDYHAFEAAIIADYDAETAVQRELVLRLASVLWRLRRFTGIGTALFELVADGAQSNDLNPNPAIANTFLHLMELPTFALDRPSRYEQPLWRQARQIVITLKSLRQRMQKPIRFNFSCRFWQRGGNTTPSRTGDFDGS